VVLAVALAGGCGGGDGGPETLSIYVSLPLSGERAGEGRAISNGARLALAEAGGRVGEFRIKAIYLDDTGGRSRWSPVASAANARRAAEDSSTIGYIGELDSGATRFSLPITNQAGIAQVSPGATAVYLTRYVTEERSPERYRPSEERTFARLVPDREDERRAALRLTRRLGEVGRVASYRFLSRFPEICRTLRSPLYVTSPFREPFRLLPRAKPFNRAYHARFGQPPATAAYGYEAMTLLLDAIDAAGGEGDSRDAVVDQVLSTTDRKSILGEYSIDANGDTTLEVITVYSIRKCHLRVGRELDVSS
jgi:ABC-type branched-subunit amino acid transport system substrate-binding protein